MFDYRVSDKDRLEIIKRLSDTIDLFNKEIEEIGDCIQSAIIELEISSEIGNIPSWKIVKDVQGFAMGETEEFCDKNK